MTNKEYNEVYDILSDLQKEFTDEEDRLVRISHEYKYRITELDNQIIEARSNENNDFKVFSPRNISLDSSDKVKEMENERETLEKEKIEADKQVSYYTDKSDKIGKVLSVLKKYAELDDDFSDGVHNVKKPDPFAAFLDDDKELDIDTVEEVDSSDIEEMDSDDIFSPKKTSSGNEIFDALVKEELDNKKIKSDNSVNIDLDNDDVDDINLESSISAGIPVDNVKKVCHKVEFTEKIINNDRVRAKLELKGIVSDLQKLINKYE